MNKQKKYSEISTLTNAMLIAACISIFVFVFANDVFAKTKTDYIPQALLSKIPDSYLEKANKILEKRSKIIEMKAAQKKLGAELLKKKLLKKKI